MPYIVHYGIYICHNIIFSWILNKKDIDNLYRFTVMELCTASLDRVFLENNEPNKYNGPMPSYVRLRQAMTFNLSFKPHTYESSYEQSNRHL